jgi:hypothetical protein
MRVFVPVLLSLALLSSCDPGPEASSQPENLAPVDEPTPVADAGTVTVESDAGVIHTTPDAGTPEPVVSFAADVQPIFLARCANCHINRTAGGLSLVAGQSWKSLVNVESACDATPLVKPGAPAESALIHKLEAGALLCGSAMPPRTAGLKALFPAEFLTIERWIRQGALDN